MKIFGPVIYNSDASSDRSGTIHEQKYRTTNKS